ncbi:MAG: hypothetical protein QM680_06510 [Luteolibacter sp.]
MAPHEYEALSREERLRRIGALFYKAVVISLARKQGIIGETGGDVPAQVGGDSPQETDTLITASLPEEDLALLRRYARLGEIAPRDATEFWGVSRTTAYRRLLGLEQGGWLEKRGAAKATRYTFTGQTRTLLERLKQSKPARDDSRASM